MRTFNIFLLFTLFATMFMAGGCVNYKSLEVTSFRIESVTPEGFRTIKLKASLDISNPSAEFLVYDMEGSIHSGRDILGSFAIDPLTVMARTDDTYSVHGLFSIARSISLLGLADMFSNAGTDNYMMDISFKIKPKGGIVQKMKFKDIPAEEIVGIFR